MFKMEISAHTQTRRLLQLTCVSVKLKAPLSLQVESEMTLLAADQKIFPVEIAGTIQMY